MPGKHAGNGSSSLRSEFFRKRKTASYLEVEAQMLSKIEAISPMVDRLMRSIEESQCVPGEEFSVELALREALNNAVIHGNHLDSRKLVWIRCRCELGQGVSIVVRDQGQGFDVTAIPDPLAAENLEAEQGRGILLMKFAMNEVSFERGGAEVRMWKGPAGQPGALTASQQRS